jgi:hypothetical protein
MKEQKKKSSGPDTIATCPNAGHFRLCLGGTIWQACSVRVAHVSSAGFGCLNRSRVVLSLSRCDYNLFLPAALTFAHLALAS